MENTHKIAQRCHVEIEFGVTKLPNSMCRMDYTSWEYLNKLMLRKDWKTLSRTVTEELKRLDYELSTIKNMGYVDYFLIVWDFIKYARDHEIMVGPGRGSAAEVWLLIPWASHSLIRFRYDLLFERFLESGTSIHARY